MRTPTGYRVERQPEFDEQDIDLLIAYREIRDDTTPRGQPWHEETSPLADPANPDSTYRYVPRRVINHAEAAIKRGWREARAEATYDGKTDETQLEGLVVYVDRVDIE